MTFPWWFMYKLLTADPVTMLTGAPGLSYGLLLDFVPLHT